MLATDGVDPTQINQYKELRNQFKELIEVGYNKMVKYETSTKGFEWFGTSPGHEVLTAYGLTLFTKMKQHGKFVNQDTMDRTKQWLMSRLNQDGSITLNPKQLDTFGRAAQTVSEVYILWVLSEIDPQGSYSSLAQRVDNLMKNNEDPYLLALYTLTLVNFNQTDKAIPFAKKITTKQDLTTG